MATKRIKTKFTGVYQREGVNRAHGRNADVCFDINYKIEGKLHWEKVGWASEGYSAKLANDIRAERLRNIRHGKELPGKQKKAPLFKAIAAEYLEWCKENKTRSGRDDFYQYKNHLAQRFDHKRMNEITPFDIERLKSDLIKDGLSLGSVKHALVVVRQIYNKARLWKLYQGHNPVSDIRLPRLKNERIRFLSPTEADTLLKELKQTSINLHDMALLSLHTGMRAGEIFNLRGRDIDFENGLIDIIDSKNGESRKAYITDAVSHMLERRIPTDANDLIFKDRKGHKIVSISQAFRRAIDRLGFNQGIDDPRQRVTFHSLRHSFASWLALQGESLLTIGQLLGHKSLTMTKRYSHLTQDHKRQAVQKLEQGFKSEKV